jgi:uncharacterized protein
MKDTLRKCLIAVTVLLTSAACAQELQEPHLRSNFIEVTGSAEAEVVPDEIYFGITLQEFEKDRKKVTLEELERGLIKVLNGLKLDVKALEVDNVYGYMHWRKKRPQEFLATKRYLLKLKDLHIVDTLIYELDEIGVNQVNIDRAEFSGIEELRLKVKTDALKAAKSKAKMLAASIGENIGKALMIREINNDYGPVYDQSMYNMKSMASEAQSAPQINYRKIRVRYEIIARFAL